MHTKLLSGICAAAVGISMLAACEKNTFKLKDNIFIDGQASLKVNYFAPYSVNRAYQIKIDNKRVSNLLTYATPFPGGGLNTGGGSYADYLAVTPGSHTVSISLPYTGTEQDSVQLATATVNVDANKTYSLYYTDTAASTVNFLMEDNLTTPDSGFAKYRFINLIPDLASVDLYFGTDATAANSTKVAGPIKYKEASAYFTVPINSGTFWSIRPGGAAATTTAIATYSNASTVINQRVFTVTARGYNSVASSADVRYRKISFIYNR